MGLFLSFFSSATFANDALRAFGLVQKGEAVLIDLREEAEIKEGMIKGSLWFPMSKVETDKKWIENFRKIIQNKKVFLYCRSGNRSGKMKELLKNEGILAQNIGGIISLKDQLPVKKP